MLAQQDTKHATERRSYLRRARTLAPLREQSQSTFITTSPSTWDATPHLTIDKRHSRKNMSQSHSVSVRSRPLRDPSMRAHEEPALRPQPSANVFKKFGLGKKPSTLLQHSSSRKNAQNAIALLAAGDEQRIRLPLGEALAISPNDETLHAIKRAHAAVAANAQGRSRQALAHKFSSAALDLIATSVEPSVIGTWSGGEPQWIGESYLQRTASRRSVSLPPPAERTGEEATPVRTRTRPKPRLTIPSMPQGSTPVDTVLAERQRGRTASRSDFAEFGYVSPVSSPTGSEVFRRSMLLQDDVPNFALLEESSRSASEQSFFDDDSDGEGSDGSSSSPSSQELNTPPQSLMAPNRGSIAWSIKDPCAAGVFEDDFGQFETSLLPQSSLRPASLAIRPVKSATLLKARASQDQARPRTAPQQDKPLPQLPKLTMEDRAARLKAAGVKQHKIDALFGLDRTSSGTIPAKSANSVVLGILRNCNSLKDLFSMAVANRGFYTAFKSQELQLMKTVLRNQSPAAWEYHETALDSLPFDEYTPAQYLAFHTRDVYVLAALKEMLCSSRHLAKDKLREQTLEALHSRLSPRAVKVDDAFWRIWTFCELFGPEKGEEEDITAQMDWLRGGEAMQASRRAWLSTLTNTADASSSAIATRAPSSTGHRSVESASGKSVQLRVPPATFGLGNPGGLDYDELQDLSEIWIGLKNLLTRVTFDSERVSQAREHGIFDDKPPHMDEHESLEEWIYYLLGLGPSVIQDIAAKEPLSDDSAFSTAKHMGWTEWEVLASGASRRTFLEEAVKRVSLDQCAEAQRLSPIEQETHELARKSRRSRGQSLAKELRETKKNADLTNIPYSEERPMSLWLHFQNQEGAQLPEPVESPSTVEQEITEQLKCMSGEGKEALLTSPTGMTCIPEEDSTISSQRKLEGGSFSMYPRPQNSQISPVHAHKRSASASYRPTNAPVRLLTRVGSRPTIDVEALRSTVNAPHELHPAFRNSTSTASVTTTTADSRVSIDDYNGHVDSPVKENSVDLFTWRIVEMGFTAEQARKALGRTDNGKSLSVDRAIEWLLSGGAAV